jgi:hypothetical protein
MRLSCALHIYSYTRIVLQAHMASLVTPELCASRMSALYPIADLFMDLHEHRGSFCAVAWETNARWIQYSIIGLAMWREDTTTHSKARHV